MNAHRLAKELHPGAPPTTPLSAIHIAIHEAAHAVIGMVQDPPLVIQRLWVDLSRKDKLGWCARRPRIDPGVIASPLHPVILSGLRDHAFADAVDTLAGPIAEELWRRRSISDLLIIGDRLRDEFDVHGSMVGGDTAPDGYADLMATERLLGWVFGPEGAGEAFSDAWTRSLWLVIRNRHLIRRLADALALRKALEHDEILEVIGPLRGRRRNQR